MLDLSMFGFDCFDLLKSLFRVNTDGFRLCDGQASRTRPELLLNILIIESLAMDFFFVIVWLLCAVIGPPVLKGRELRLRASFSFLKSYAVSSSRI